MRRHSCCRRLPHVMASHERSCGRRGRTASQPGSATGRQSSIGAMTESPGEEARFLTRNAVDALPEGALERQLGEGRPLRVKLGIDPTAPDIHLGHTVVLRKLREFQDRGHTVVLIIGDYTARVGDPSGRSSTRPGALRGGDRRQRRDLPAPGVPRARPRAHRGPAQRRVARHADGGPVQARPDRDRRAAARARRLRQALRRRASRSRSSSCSTRCSRATTRWRSTRTSSSAPPTRSSTSSSRATSSRPTASRPQSILTMPILPGTDGLQKMSKSLGNHVGLTEPPEEMFGKLMRVPDEAMPVYYELLLDEPFDAGAPAVESKRRMARPAHRAAARRRGRPRRGGALRPPPRGARAARRDRGPRGGARERLGPPAGRDQGRLWHLLLGGAPAAHAGRA